MIEDTAAIPDTPRFARTAHQALTLWRRLPFTVTVTALMLVAGLVTGALWDAAADRSWFPRIAYGLPAFLDGAWWTPVTGAFFALEPGIYLPMVGSFVLLAGYTEFKLGTRIAAVTVIGGQLIGVLGAAAVLLPLQFTDWAWAQELSGHLDLGFSAGALAGLAVVSGTLRDPWRLRVRLALLAYVAISFVLIGALADLEHLIAVIAALILAPLLIDITPAHRPSRREWRLLAATGLALTAVVEVVASVIPADGPVGSTSLLSDSSVGVAVTVVVVALVVNSLRHGRRLRLVDRSRPRRGQCVRGRAVRDRRRAVGVRRVDRRHGRAVAGRTVRAADRPTRVRDTGASADRGGKPPRRSGSGVHQRIVAPLRRRVVVLDGDLAGEPHLLSDRTAGICWPTSGTQEWCSDWVTRSGRQNSTRRRSGSSRRWPIEPARRRCCSRSTPGPGRRPPRWAGGRRWSRRTP